MRIRGKEEEREGGREGGGGGERSRRVEREKAEDAGERETV